VNDDVAGCIAGWVTLGLLGLGIWSLGRPDPDWARQTAAYVFAGYAAALILYLILSLASETQEWPVAGDGDTDFGFGALTAGPLEILQVILTVVGAGAALATVVLLPVKMGWLDLSRVTVAFRTADVGAEGSALSGWRLGLLSLYYALMMLVAHAGIIHLVGFGGAACITHFLGEDDHPHLRHAASILTGGAGLGLLWVIWQSRALIYTLLSLPVWQYACVGGGGILLGVMALVAPALSFGYNGRRFVVRSYQRLGLLHRAARGYEGLAERAPGSRQRIACLMEAIACYDRLGQHAQAAQVCERLPAYTAAAERYVLAAGLRPEELLN